MYYIESNLFNELHILPLGVRRELGVCPREELVDPRKLEGLLHEREVSWDVFEHMDNVFFRAYLSWRNEWEMIDNCTIRSVGFYLMTEHPMMFQRLRAILERPSHIQLGALTQWLVEWWQTPFLITSPVLGQLDKGARIPQPYFVNNRYPVQKVPLQGDDDILTQMLGSEGYTICNGLTFFLAMVRASRIKTTHAQFVLRNMLKQQEHVNLIAPVAFQWTNLYLGHTTPHVCDHPWIYASMGKHPAPPIICNLLRNSDDFIIPQFGGIDVGSVTGIVSARLRYAPSHMHWPHPPPMQNDDQYRPDIASFILGVIQNKKEWKWWCRFGREFVLFTTGNFFETQLDAMTAWIQALAQFYSCAKEHTQRLCTSRIRSMWFDVMDYLDPDGEVINTLLRKWIIKDIVTSKLKERGFMILSMNYQIPYALLKDVFEFYGPKVQLWTASSSVITGDASFIPSLLEVFPRGNVIESERRSIRIKYSLMHYFKIAAETSVYGVFFRTYLEARVVSRILALRKGFGMNEDEDHSFGKKYDNYNMSLIGFLVMEHLRDNKESLVF